MDKLMHFEGVIQDPKLNPNCNLITEFQFRNNTNQHNHTLNYFCNIGEGTAEETLTSLHNNLDLQSPSNVQVKATYLHIPKIFSYGSIKNNAFTGPFVPMTQHFSGLVCTSIETNIAINGPAIYGEKDCGDTFSVLSLENAGDMIFQFNNHFFIPFTLMTGRSLFYAFEDERIAINWVNYIESKDYNVGIAVRDSIYSENILGIALTKSVFLIEWERDRMDAFDRRPLAAKEYFDPLTEWTSNRIDYQATQIP